jgi:hypothetical protein
MIFRIRVSFRTFGFLRSFHFNSPFIFNLESSMMILKHKREDFCEYTWIWWRFEWKSSRESFWPFFFPLFSSLWSCESPGFALELQGLVRWWEFLRRTSENFAPKSRSKMTFVAWLLDWNLRLMKNSVLCHVLDSVLAWIWWELMDFCDNWIRLGFWDDELVHHVLELFWIFVVFDSFLWRERKLEVFLMSCCNLNGTAMIGAFYRLPSVLLDQCESATWTWTL